MQPNYLIMDLALIFVAAGLATVIFRKLNQPLVLGYIVAGFLVSPNFSHMPSVVETADISVWADIGVVFLMFALGLEFSFKRIAKVGGSAFVIVFTVMSLMILTGVGVGSLLGWGRMDCIFLGGMLSMSSTMIILKAYEEYGLKEEKFARLVMGTLVLEDIAGIFMMIILSTISASSRVNGLEMAGHIAMMLGLLAVWLIAGIYLIPSLLKKIRELMNDELTLVISTGICMGMVVIANLIGFSSALGAFMAGSILAGTVQSASIERIITPVKNLFGAVFFVSVGMLIDYGILLEYLWPVIILSAVTIAGQMVFSTLGIILSGQSLHTAVRGGFSMVQIGEFSFIVATLGMSLGVISTFLYPVIVCVSVVTSFLTPVFIRNSERAYSFLDRKLPQRLRIFLRRNTSDDQSENDKDRDWSLYIRAVITRTAIGAMSMFLIYLGGTRFLDPLIRGHIQDPLAGRLLSAVIIAGAMIPFAAVMQGSNNNGKVAKLWLKRRTNRLPLLTLKGIRILISACFIALVLRKLFMIPYWILVLLSAIPIAMIVHSDYVRSRTINMEIRFMSNFEEKTLARRKKERGLKGGRLFVNESLFVSEYAVKDRGHRRTIADFAASRAFTVTVIKIKRDGRSINMPVAGTEVMDGDYLHVMGTKDEIDACRLLLRDEDCIEDTPTLDRTLKDYVYSQTFLGIPPEDQIISCPVRVGEESEFLKKSIKNSGMRDRYRGTIIGIERDDLPIINPDKETMIMQGDLLWVLGTARMADFLIKGNILTDR